MAGTNGLPYVLTQQKKLLFLLIILLLVIGFVLWLANQQMNEINQLMPVIGCLDVRMPEIRLSGVAFH